MQVWCLLVLEHPGVPGLDMPGLDVVSIAHEYGLRRRPGRGSGCTPPARARRVNERRPNLEQLRLTAAAIARSALAAGFAWFLCHDLLGHVNGIWGPLGAVIALSPPGRSSRRVIEIAGGAVVGVAVGNLLIAAIGTGPIQVAAVTFLAMATATVLSAEAGVVTQSGIASALIATIGHHTGSTTRSP